MLSADVPRSLNVTSRVSGGDASRLRPAKPTSAARASIWVRMDVELLGRHLTGRRRAAAGGR